MKKIIYSSLTIVLLLVSTINQPNNNTHLSVNALINEYDEVYYYVAFDSLNSKDFLDVFGELNVVVYEIKPKSYNNVNFKYYVNKIDLESAFDDLINMYKEELIKNGYHEESIYYNQKGFLIESVVIKCTSSEMEKINLLANVLTYKKI